MEPHIDNVANNNMISSGSFNIISPNAFATSHTEGFEGYSNQTTAPNNALLLNPQTQRVFIVDATWPGPNAGGYGNSQNSFRWSFVDQSFSNGNYAELVLKNLISQLQQEMELHIHTHINKLQDLIIISCKF